jgi:RNA polymerase sigma factor (sigma-70 family)
MIPVELVDKAKEGDRNALGQLLESVRDRLYNLSLRMLWHPEDAEDATQEILIRIFTHLSTFRGECSFLTWAYRVASNYLLTTRKRRMENTQITFEAFAEDLDRGISSPSLTVHPEAERRLLAEEVKIGCTHAMLLCLDREHRLSYILGEILEIGAQEGASVLQISPAAFRKRLSRARKSIAEFMNRKCGLINSANSCLCSKRIPYAIEKGRVNPDQLLFAGRPVAKRLVLTEVQRLHSLQDAASLLRSHPAYAAPNRLIEEIRKLISSDTIKFD